ncbi:hypothetical protein THRCLA_21240 [Thraustotheca clavata]|uniref:Uncharacterized protein n=1 Tax=Thraustotheca clavata TaxID=74557 RepID=A0A1V9ZYS6_9STRA|nr:hypothetical protein THRCLA_21240 [Thraustotheca clavata]
MGAGASLNMLSANDVADEIGKLGDAYQVYTPLFTKNGIDGGILASLNEHDLDNLLVDMGISSALHRKILLLHLSKLKVIKAPDKDPSSSSHQSVPTLSPAEILAKLFEFQGIHLIDPDDMESTVAKIIPIVPPADALHAPESYDCFISYRVATEKDIAEKLYLHLKSKGFNVFLDRMCLKNGEPWKDGFLRGLETSRVFLALVSEAALTRARDRNISHEDDNLLLEYEVALRIATSKQLKIFPILVASNSNGNFVKFSGFSPDLYSPTIAPQGADDNRRRFSVPIPELEDRRKYAAHRPSVQTLPTISSQKNLGIEPDINRKLSLAETMSTNFEEMVATLLEGSVEDISDTLEKLFSIVQRTKYAVKFALSSGWTALIDILCLPGMEELQKDYAAGALSFIAPALINHSDQESLESLWADIEKSLEEHHAELIENVLLHGSEMQKQYITVALMHLCKRDHLRDVLKESEELQIVLEEMKPLGSVIQAQACASVLSRCFASSPEAAVEDPPPA